MNNENKRNDFIFFQNEILGDVKRMETRLNEKLSQMKKFLESETQKNDIKIEDLTNRLGILTEKLNDQSTILKIEESIKKSRQKIEELVGKIEIKQNILDRDFNNACFKYDKIFTNNLIVPGLIGNSCPYDTLKPFLEFTNQKLGELIKYKEKQMIDTKKYKEKLESIISQNNIQLETAQNKITDYCSQGFNQCDIICQDRTKILEKRIEALRVENGEYSYNLQKRADDLQIEWEKLNEMENRLNKKYNEELNKFNAIIDKISNKFDKNKEEFYLIKNKFTELSEFIKDIRFRKNLNNINKMNNINGKREILNERDVTLERRIFREMSNKIDFSKRHKIKKIQNFEKERILNDKALGPYDNFNNNSPNSEEKNDEIENDNISIEDNSSINIIIDNDNEDKINKNPKEIEASLNDNSRKNKNIKDLGNQNHIYKVSCFFSEKKLNKSETNPNILKNTNDNSINNKSEIINSKNNFNKKDMNYYKTEKKKENIKSINIKRTSDNTNNLVNSDNNLNNSTHLNSNNRYINENSKINIKNNINQNNLERNSIKDNKEQNKYLLCLNENAKINDLILGANFNNKVNTPSYNLSQAYLLLRKRSEEFQKIRKIRGGIGEKKLPQLTPSSIINQSRNLNKNLTLQLFSPKDAKSNKEDLYYSSFRKNKQKGTEIHQNINLNLTNQENLKLNLEKQNFPRILKKQINPNSKLSNNIIVEYNTININDNNFDNKFDNKFSSPKEKNSKKMKKLLYSSSDNNLPVNLNPIFPNYKEYFSNDNETTDEKNKK